MSKFLSWSLTLSRARYVCTALNAMGSVGSCPDTGPAPRSSPPINTAPASLARMLSGHLFNMAGTTLPFSCLEQIPQ